MAILMGAILRAALFASAEAVPYDLAGEALLVGLRLDLVVASYFAAPLVPFLLSTKSGYQRLAGAYVAIVVGALALASPVEFWFFRYYGFRPNYLLLEHGLDPEVWSTIYRRYVSVPYLIAIGASGAVALLLRAAIATLVAAILERPDGTMRVHPPVAVLGVAAFVVLGARGTLDHRPLNPSAASISSNRVLNEITGSAWLNVAYEVVRRGRADTLRLSDVQRLLPRSEARERVQRLVCSGGSHASADLGCSAGDSLAVAHAASGLRNVVVVVMESFTARLVGSLGGQPALSPDFDALAREGVLLSNCYATGERTVQGLEAVLSSFPPLPGVSVVRRPEAQTGFVTLASVLAERGYDSLFLYGGQGIFDHMRSFFLGNGFNRFIEERDFERPSFRGGWGVSDEDLFHRANRELQRRWEQGVPFVAAILTVSLHSPWEYPKGRAPALPLDASVPDGFERAELANFLYADFALGEFIREARTLPYFRDTLFVFVGDHGIHLRGRALVPSEEYRVPALFYAPSHLAARRIEEVTSQIDIAPTILGLLREPTRAPFFGRDVLQEEPPRGGLATMIYSKRHYAARRADRLTVLVEGGARKAYWMRPGDAAVETEPTLEHIEDSLDALALAQVAEDRLDHEKHRVVAQSRIGDGSEVIVGARSKRRLR